MRTAGSLADVRNVQDQESLRAAQIESHDLLAQAAQRIRDVRPRILAHRRSHQRVANVVAADLDRHQRARGRYAEVGEIHADLVRQIDAAGIPGDRPRAAHRVVASLLRGAPQSGPRVPGEREVARQALDPRGAVGEMVAAFGVRAVGDEQVVQCVVGWDVLRNSAVFVCRLGEPVEGVARVGQAGAEGDDPVDVRRSGECLAREPGERKGRREDGQPSNDA
jgi:hypothetical protein